MLNIYNQKNGNYASKHNAAPISSSTVNTAKAFTRYIDPTAEFTTSELKTSLWISRHRVLLYRIFLWLLVGLNVCFWSFFIFKGVNLLSYQLFSIQKFDQELSFFPDYTIFHARYSPQPLLVADTQIFSGGLNQYDLISLVTNPNERFYVSFIYDFIVDGKPMAAEGGSAAFLLPGETRPLYAGLKTERQNLPTDAELVIHHLRWHRISSHQVIDVAAWQAERLNFLVSDFVFTRADANDLDAHIIRFNLTNASPYSFKFAEFWVGLYQGETMVGIIPLDLSPLPAGETRTIDRRSFVEGLMVTDIKIFPLIDIYRDEIYLPPESR